MNLVLVKRKTLKSLFRLSNSCQQNLAANIFIPFLFLNMAADSQLYIISKESLLNIPDNCAWHIGNQQTKRKTVQVENYCA